MQGTSIVISMIDCFKTTTVKSLLLVLVSILAIGSYAQTSIIDETEGFADYKFGMKDVACPKGIVNDFSCTPSIAVGGYDVDHVSMDATQERGVYVISVFFKVEKNVSKTSYYLKKMLIEKYGEPNRFGTWQGEKVKISLRDYYNYPEQYVRIDYFKYNEVKEVGL